MKRVKISVRGGMCFKELTSSITIVVGYVCEVEWKENLGQLLRRQSLARQVTGSYNKICFQIKYLGTDVVELDWKEIAVSVDLKVEVRRKGEIGWDTREDGLWWRSSVLQRIRGSKCEAGYTRDGESKYEADSVRQKIIQSYGHQ